MSTRCRFNAVPALQRMGHHAGSRHNNISFQITYTTRRLSVFDIELPVLSLSKTIQVRGTVYQVIYTYNFKYLSQKLFYIYRNVLMCSVIFRLIFHLKYSLIISILGVGFLTALLFVAAISDTMDHKELIYG